MSTNGIAELQENSFIKQATSQIWPMDHLLTPGVHSDDFLVLVRISLALLIFFLL
jgi:hypothetical protein